MLLIVVVELWLHVGVQSVVKYFKPGFEYEINLVVKLAILQFSELFIVGKMLHKEVISVREHSMLFKITG